jgi:hypothetical protein
MSSRTHPQARTTPKIWQEIKESGLSDREADKVSNITRAAAEWLKGDDVHDSSQRPHTLHTTLSATHIVLSLRQSLYLPLDDLPTLPVNISTLLSRVQASRACSSAKACRAWRTSSRRQKAKRSRQIRPSRTVSLASFTSTSNTCHRCQTRHRVVICS